MVHCWVKLWLNWTVEQLLCQMLKSAALGHKGWNSLVLIMNCVICLVIKQLKILRWDLKQSQALKLAYRAQVTSEGLLCLYFILLKWKYINCKSISLRADTFIQQTKKWRYTTQHSHFSIYCFPIHNMKHKQVVSTPHTITPNTHPVCCLFPLRVV